MSRSGSCSPVTVRAARFAASCSGVTAPESTTAAQGLASAAANATASGVSPCVAASRASGEDGPALVLAAASLPRATALFDQGRPSRPQRPRPPRARPMAPGGSRSPPRQRKAARRRWSSGVRAATSWPAADRWWSGRSSPRRCAVAPSQPAALGHPARRSPRSASAPGKAQAGCRGRRASARARLGKAASECSLTSCRGASSRQSPV